MDTVTIFLKAHLEISLLFSAIIYDHKVNISSAHPLRGQNSAYSFHSFLVLIIFTRILLGIERYLIHILSNCCNRSQKVFWGLYNGSFTPIFWFMFLIPDDFYKSCRTLVENYGSSLKTSALGLSWLGAFQFLMDLTTVIIQFFWGGIISTTYSWDLFIHYITGGDLFRTAI